MPLTGYDDEDAFYRIDAQMDREEMTMLLDEREDYQPVLHRVTCSDPHCGMVAFVATRGDLPRGWTRTTTGDARCVRCSEGA